MKKLFLKILQYSQESNCVGVFLCILRIFIYFEKLRTAASDYSFTMVIYLFSYLSLYRCEEKL